ncbi:MAG: beta-glucosidase BglX [Bacteroidales bacterium]|jgi:beta-glucosidase|nr:beta-glucosidase BglX [Bacteroidales bacterium]
MKGRNKIRKIMPAAVAVLSLILTVSCNSEGGKKSEMDGFVGNLMKKMTLEEKIGQMNLPTAGDITTGQAKNSNIAEAIKKGEVGGLFNIKGASKISEIQKIAVKESRLGIPLIFGMDVIHGYETVFPIPLGLAATWDMKAIEEYAHIAATEATASGICWTFSPMVDISRDPRWGRVAEGIGEDPFLGSAIARAMVKGYQGDNTFSGNDRMMACVKHFALYGAPVAGRDYNTVDMSRSMMYNIYFPPYKAAVEQGAGSIMCSFNEIDGIPATANKWLLTDVLRKQWRFGGFVVTDYTGISEMIAHGIGNAQEVAVKALGAGVDMDMVSGEFLKYVKRSIKEGKVSEKEVDEACRRILEAKYKLGLFKDPYKFCNPDREKKEVYTPGHMAEARKIAAESFVLLKNEGNLLPLKQNRKIAVVGLMANSGANMPGTWSVAADFSKPKTILKAIREAAGRNAKVTYSEGSRICLDSALSKNITSFGKIFPDITRSDAQMTAEAIKNAKNADVVIAVLGECSEMSGECSSRTNTGIPDAQENLLKALYKTGKPVVLVLFAGRPMTIPWEDKHIPSILNIWFPGSAGGDAVADILFGKTAPQGKLPSTWPRNTGQIPIFYNHKNTGRPLEKGKWFTKFRSNYLDVPNSPLYPFGYGLTYTTFAYSNLKLSSDGMKPDGSITATATLTNTGSRTGTETVQMYIRDMSGSVTRPVKELKGFKKVTLEPGESEQVSFEITDSLLKFYNYDLKYTSEPGDFKIMIGGNSEDVLSADFILKK